jgi:hypothetical protein
MGMFISAFAVSTTNLFAAADGGVFSTAINNSIVNAKVFLQGPFNTGTGTMTTTLNSNAFLPLTSETAYPAATYGYTARTVASIPNANIVDWILVELRTGTAANTKIAAQAGFLKNDGTIVDLDGTSLLSMSVNEGNYYVVVRHRNHLAIMSAATVALNDASSLYDFTTAQAKAYGTNPMASLSGVYGMWAGDANGDGVVKYNLSNNDRLLIYNRIGNAGLNVTVNGYYSEDLNLDGIVKYNLSNNDRLLIYNVIGNGGLNVTKATQVPN